MTDVAGPLTGSVSGTVNRVGISRTGAVFAGMVGIGLALPFVQFRANRIVPGDGLPILEAVPAGLAVMLVFAALALAGAAGRTGLWLRLVAAVAGLAMIVLALGLAARGLTAPDAPMARVSPGAGFWVLGLGFALMATDALARLELSLRKRALFLVLVATAVVAVPASGWLDKSSVMVDYAARSELFGRALRQHLFLAFGSLGLALVIGLPLGMAVHRSNRLRKPLLGLLNMLQTIPSLALFGIMIPIFGWIAASVPGAAALGVAGIGPFPALVALFLYALLPVVSNTWIGLASVSASVRDAA
ncbi:MAG: ABC transporter permease, partial [Paracoccus sp. (in: a-proteobacteria)]|nr:ABC transporter permease [Paracoccus sp. (in: a-proteobacteria)]